MVLTSALFWYMITRKFTKLVVAGLAFAALSLSAVWSAQRVATYSEALEKAGDDGIVVYCYGPDWNRRSVRMLNSFWKNPETEAAVGNAVMVAIPFYENQNHPKAAEASEIRCGFPEPPFGVCPLVVMLDKTGRAYAHLPGTDYLGDEEGEKGRENMRAYRAKFQRYQEIMKKVGLAEGSEGASSVQGAERAKLISEAMDLQLYIPGGSIHSMPPYIDPHLLKELEMSDPSDKTGLVRRQSHVELQFRYKLFDTSDGFLKPDFEADYAMIKKECFKIIEDPAYRTWDRQAAYLTFIGQSRREAIQPNQLKGHIKKMGAIDPNTVFGRGASALHDLWGNYSARRTPEQRKADREKRKEDAKKKKDKKIRERKQEDSIEF